MIDASEFGVVTEKNHRRRRRRDALNGGRLRGDDRRYCSVVRSIEGGGLRVVRLVYCQTRALVGVVGLLADAACLPAAGLWMMMIVQAYHCLWCADHIVVDSTCGCASFSAKRASRVASLDFAAATTVAS